MSSGTLGRVIYRIRPAKNVERKMICEAMATLCRLEPLPAYQYVGLGSLEFHDFALFYQRLGIRTMVSIEKRDSAEEQARIGLNRPYGHIVMEWGVSTERLTDINWNSRSIVWLDYDYRITPSMLDDVQFLVSELPSGSCLIVTVCCEPWKASLATPKVGRMRFERLIRAVGRARIPDGIGGKDLRDWGLGEVSRRIIRNEIETTLAARSGALAPDDRMTYSQVFNFRYADGPTKMATFGGILVSRRDEVRLSGPDFAHLPYYRPDTGDYHIRIPRLTLREVHYLNQKMPDNLSSVTAIPTNEVEKYLSIHRYFPEFLEVEMT